MTNNKGGRSMSGKKISRRKMIKGGAAAAGLFTIVPKHVLGGITRSTAPSAMHPRGILGWGSQAHSDYGAFSETGGNGCPVIATAEVDGNRLNSDGHGERTQDWREVITRNDIDFVQVCTPPHWHALMAIAAAEAGMDIWCEKPMTRTMVLLIRLTCGAFEKTGDERDAGQSADGHHKRKYRF
jgi:hypothetical protein